MVDKITERQFSGAARIHDGSLADILRKMAQDHARVKAAAAAKPVIVDSSTGSAKGAIFEMVLPLTHASQASGTAQQLSHITDFIDDMRNAGAVLVGSMNPLRKAVGLDELNALDGSVATANKIPAIRVGGGRGTPSGSFVTVLPRMLLVKQNVRALAFALQEAQEALGLAVIEDQMTGAFDRTPELAAVANPSGGDDGVLDGELDAFYVSAANNIATIAKAWNDMAVPTAGLQVVAGR